MALFASALVYSASPGNVVSSLMFRSGNCAVLLNGAPLLASPSGSPLGVQLSRNDPVVILGTEQAGFVEVAPLDDWLGDCTEFDLGVFAGWTHKQNIRKVLERSDSKVALLDLPANLRNAPNGRKIGQFSKQASATILAQDGEWFFVSGKPPKEAGLYGAKDRSWRQTKGFISSDLLSPIALAGSPPKELATVDDRSVTAFGSTVSFEDRCEGEFYFLLTRHSRFPLAVLCVGQLDGESNAVAVLGPKQRPKVSVLKPEDTTYRVTDLVLLSAIETLLK